jgi:hypothetical protein
MGCRRFDLHCKRACPLLHQKRTLDTESSITGLAFSLLPIIVLIGGYAASLVEPALADPATENFSESCHGLGHLCRGRSSWGIYALGLLRPT